MNCHSKGFYINKAKKKKFSRDFSKRAKKARTPLLSPDVWSKEASSYLRMAIFAGFEASPLIRLTLRHSKGNKVNIRSVEWALTQLEKLYKGITK